jgi:large subunit ribosomal protein L25
MEQIELKAEKRSVSGKKVRFLRRDGIIPLHLFGHAIESMSLQTDSSQIHKVLSQAGRTRLINLKVGRATKPRNVMVREVQKDPIGGFLLHVDLYEVSMTEKIRLEIPIVLVGESAALKISENMLYQDMNTLSVECLPDKIPDKIEVDLGAIKEVDQAIRVKDIQLVDVTILNEPELVIAKVSLRPAERVEEEAPKAEAVAAEGAEGEAAEGAAEAKGEPKAEAKGGAKPEVKGGAKPEAKAESKGGAKAEEKKK